MISYDVKYQDWDGNERTEKYRFNISEVELSQLNARHGGSLKNEIARIFQEKNQKALMELLMEILRAAYGVMDDDRVHFRKSDQIWDNWISTPGFEKFFLDVMSSDVKSAEFVKGVLPKKIQEAADSKDVSTEMEALMSADVTIS